MQKSLSPQIESQKAENSFAWEKYHQEAKQPLEEIWKYQDTHLEKECSVEEDINKTLQDLRMLSSVTIYYQVTRIVMNSGSQLSVL